MIKKRSRKKLRKLTSRQLCMQYGSATNKLRKKMFLHFAQQLDLDTCFQCGERIENYNEISIEHKVPWLHSEDPVGLFFSLDNIAFSHMKCNSSAARRPQKGIPSCDHGTRKRYDRWKCRCPMCKEAKRRWNAIHRKNGIKYTPKYCCLLHFPRGHDDFDEKIRST